MCRYGHDGHPAWKEAVSQVAHLLAPSARPWLRCAQTARHLRTALQTGNSELGMLGGMQAVAMMRNSMHIPLATHSMP